VGKWHFYEGMNNEWHWYEMSDAGDVIGASECAFSSLDACMDNARERGFDPSTYQVHLRERAMPHPQRNKATA
jgi:hypothetical protein